MPTADCYRRRAAECQHLADAAMSESVRDTLQEIAQKYLALATNEERLSSTMLDVAAKGRPPQSPDARG
jgi:hypothetical protein